MNPDNMTAAQLRTPVRYLRKTVAPKNRDDFARGTPKFETVATGRIALEAKAGADIEIADGLEQIVTYDAVDRWQPGILVTDFVETEDGRRLNIRRRVNHNAQNRWAVMTLVHRPGDRGD